MFQKVKGVAVSLERCVLVEQDGDVRVASVCNELIGDVRNMITGFLKNNRMELSTGRRDNIGGFPAGPSWIPLKNRERVLMMHEIAVNCINVTEPVRFGLTKFDHRKNKGSWFRKQGDRDRETEKFHERFARQTLSMMFG